MSTIRVTPTLPLLLALSLSATLYAIAAPASSNGPPVGTAHIAVAAQGGLLQDVGHLNPHAYRPNELFAQNWVYEGLVHYGPGGKIEPALAESWEVKPAAADGTQDIVFKLRRFGPQGTISRSCKHPLIWHLYSRQMPVLGAHKAARHATSLRVGHPRDTLGRLLIACKFYVECCVPCPCSSSRSCCYCCCCCTALHCANLACH
jgi:hypothetical protein